METHTLNDLRECEGSSRQSETVCIFGTGDFGKALSYKMLQCGYNVVFGSRNPQKSNLLPKGAEVVSYTEAAQRSAVVFLAIHKDHYPCLKELTEVLCGKVLVDVSNNLKLNQYQDSNAEYLAQLIPGAEVVKAFNTVSAWALQSGTLDASRQVFVCGNNSKSKQKVMDIVRTLGLTPLDQGSLVAAKEVENYPLQLFPMWRLTMYIATALTVVIFLYCVVIEVIYSYVNAGEDTTYLIIITIPNRVFPIVSLILLAVVYLAGIIAAAIQLYKGTKYNRFPEWLDKWMLCRKQLGLVALAYAFLHAIYTLVMPIRYYVRWWKDYYLIPQIKTNVTEPFVKGYAWGSDGYLALGILGFFFFVLLGITSLPSVSNAMNWREFQFVQSKLGYLTLLLCTGHTIIFGWNRFLIAAQYKWYLPLPYMFSLVIPCIVLVMKLILITPCVDRTITQIRQGWERQSKSTKMDKTTTSKPTV